MTLTQHFQSLFILALLSRFSCLSFRDDLINTTKLLDLTHDFHEDMSHVIEKFSVTYINYTLPGRPDWYTREIIETPIHIGTHLDAPCFTNRNHWGPEAIPLDRLILPAILVDISNKVNGSPNVHLMPKDLMDWEFIYGPIPDGCLVLIHTGWAQFWSDPSKYTGKDNSGRLNFPSITPEAAQWLAGNRNIYGIGVDSLSVDAYRSMSRDGQGRGLGSHHYFFSRGIYGLENLNNLHRVPPVGSVALVMPIKYKGLTGAPARVILQLP